MVAQNVLFEAPLPALMQQRSSKTRRICRMKNLEGDVLMTKVRISRRIDRRAFLWMKASVEDSGSATNRDPRRITYAELNFDDLKFAMKKTEKKMDQQFLDRKIVAGIGPWAKPSEISPPA